MLSHLKYCIIETWYSWSKIYFLKQAEVHSIAIKAKFLKKLKVYYKNEKGRRITVKIPGNNLPRGGQIKFAPPVLMKSFKVKILKLTGRKKLVKGFRLDILGCTEKPQVTIYNETKTTTPHVTYTSKLRLSMFFCIQNFYYSSIGK